ncbi:MAG: hypothetical protein AB3N20_22270 [Rhizobiaceae bacterium]
MGETNPFKQPVVTFRRLYRRFKNYRNRPFWTMLYAAILAFPVAMIIVLVLIVIMATVVEDTSINVLEGIVFLFVLGPLFSRDLAHAAAENTDYHPQTGTFSRRRGNDYIHSASRRFPAHQVPGAQLDPRLDRDLLCRHISWSALGLKHCAEASVAAGSADNLVIRQVTRRQAPRSMSPHGGDVTMH